MKKCPFCAEEIQEAAIVCKHCGRDLVATPPKQKAGGAGKAVGVALLVMLGIGWCASLINTSTSGRLTSDDRSTATSSLPQLELLASKQRRSAGGSYLEVEGQVKNISSEALQRVTAVTSWSDSSGKFITSDQAIIEYDPILPGQTSPFKTMTRINPLMENFSVEFKHLTGGTIPTLRSDR